MFFVYVFYYLFYYILYYIFYFDFIYLFILYALEKKTHLYMLRLSDRWR